jgi:hypothetical protein
MKIISGVKVKLTQDKMTYTALNIVLVFVSHASQIFLQIGKLQFLGYPSERLKGISIFSAIYVSTSKPIFGTLKAKLNRSAKIKSKKVIFDGS